MKEKFIKDTQLIFWVTSIFAIVLMVAFHLVNDAKPAAENTVDQTVSSLAILSLLIGIPAALKLYHLKTTEKVPKGKDEAFLIKSLQILFFIRQNIIMTIMLFNYIAFELFGYSTAIYGVAICAIVLFVFCRPGRESLTSTLSEMEKISNLDN